MGVLRRTPPRRARRLVAGLAALALVGACSERDPERPGPSDTSGGGVVAGNFSTNCKRVHSSEDDPIVFPNNPGESHQHDFYGGDPALPDFSSVTYSQLRSAPTGCREPDDTALYWQPSLSLGGREIAPVPLNAYYRNDLDPARVVPFPPDLRIVAGDSTASADAPQDLKRVWWSCGRGGPPKQTTPIDCTGTPIGKVTAHVVFPQCWDGRSIDSADHRSHMAYPSAGRCSGSHPVQVPKLGLAFRWPIANGVGATLSCGSPYCLHADFINAWDQDQLAELVRECLVPDVNCNMLTAASDQ